MFEYKYKTEMTYKMLFEGGFSKEHGDLIVGEEYLCFITIEIDVRGKPAIFIETNTGGENWSKIRYSTLLRFAKDWKMKESIFMEDNHYKLRPYQTEAVAQAMKALGEHQKGRNPSIITVPTAGGKSLVIAELCHQLDAPTLILQPSKEILEQNYAKLEMYGIEDIGIYSASCRKKEIGKYTYATIGSIVKKPELFEHIEYILIDECFPAGTRVGRKKIENIKVGDYVDCVSDTGAVLQYKVKRTSKKPIPKQMVLTKYHDGSTISTLNHPFFVDGRGYISACQLKKGDYVYCKQPNKVRPLWEILFCKYSAVLSKKQRKNNFLLRLLSFSSKQGKNAQKQSNEKSRNKKKNVRNAQENWSQTCYKARKWLGINDTARTLIKIAWSWLGGRITNSDFRAEREWLSYLLQNGFGMPPENASSRTRWRKPLFKTTQRFEETEEIRRVRVESVEILEQGSDGRFGGRDLGDYVYNLEVERFHNYFANGVLVHNCHLGSKAGSMLDKFTHSDALKGVKIVGLTATPFILQARSRKLPNGFILTQQLLQPLTRCYPCKWRKIAYNINTSELLKQKYLSPLRYVESNWKCSRLKVNTIGSDFTKDSLQEYGMESVDHIVRAIDFSLNKEGKKKVLVFCPCLETANAINKIMGYPVVSGETPKKEREAILENFKNGETDVVLNYGVLTTGFDFPELDCIVCARPTLSLALWYQMVGRGFRIAHGKKECLVCDLSGNTERLGKVETIEMRKEAGGWKDEVWTSAGKVSGIPLSTFIVK